MIIIRMNNITIITITIIMTIAKVINKYIKHA